MRCWVGLPHAATHTQASPPYLQDVRLCPARRIPSGVVSPSSKASRLRVRTWCDRLAFTELPGVVLCINEPRSLKELRPTCTNK